MPAFSFVHAADLHLDSPFLGVARLPEGQSRVTEAQREATFKAFESVIDLCLQRGADFLLVAGDVYDGADRSLQAQLRFRNGLRRLCEAGIRAYIVHGNHDPLDGWTDSIEMPDGAHIFGPDLDSVVFEKDGQPAARIHGISYPKRDIGKRFGKGLRREGDEPFQIGLFHCNAGGDTKHEAYAPRTESELAEAELDYWALGHIHESRTLRENDPFIGYPGNTQGRHANETGPRGCFFAQISAEGGLSAQPEFVATDAVRWLSAVLDISELETMDDLLARLERRLGELADQGEGRPVVTRITLLGRGPLHRSLSRADSTTELLAELHSLGADRDPFVWVEKLLVRTRPEVDLAARRESKDFLGNLLCLIDQVRSSPEEMAGLREVLGDLYEHGRAKRVLDPPDDDALLGLLEEAEARCVDLLLEDDD